MKVEHVKNYIDNQIQQRADDAIRPLMTAIASEVENQRRIGDTLKAAQENLKAAQEKAVKDLDESNQRLAKLQANLNQAKADVSDFATKLEASTEAAATRK